MKNTRVYLALCAFLCFSVRAFSQDILQDSDAATIQDAVSSLPFFEGTVMNPRLEINDVEPQPVHMLTSDENISEVAEDLGNLASIAQEVLGEVSQQQAEEEPKIAGMAETQDPVQEFLEAVQEAMDQSPQQEGVKDSKVYVKMETPQDAQVEATAPEENSMTPKEDVEYCMKAVQYCAEVTCKGMPVADNRCEETQGSYSTTCACQDGTGAYSTSAYSRSETRSSPQQEPTEENPFAGMYSRRFGAFQGQQQQQQRPRSLDELFNSRAERMDASPIMASPLSMLARMGMFGGRGRSLSGPIAIAVVEDSSEEPVSRMAAEQQEDDQERVVLDLSRILGDVSFSPMAMMRSIPVRFGMSMPVVVEVEEAAPQQSGTMGREGEGMMGREGGRMMGHEGKRMMDREGERMMGREGERMNMMMGMDPETRMQHMRMMERPGELERPPPHGPPFLCMLFMLGVFMMLTATCCCCASPRNRSENEDEAMLVDVVDVDAYTPLMCKEEACPEEPMMPLAHEEAIKA
mmetsp:Transcript_36339/g.69719  ORF Transcript_36339/g.69719 Transcript_36339/m.69719 type:complete len:520 (+) Transcript_36339:161-1720(+)